MAKNTHITALVTGSSRGIGAAIARSLSENGAEVILHFNQNGNAAHKVASQCPGKTHIIQSDLSQTNGARRLWKDAQERAQRPINLLVNNAAIMPSAGVQDDWDQWDEVWRNVMQTNVIACADLCRCAIDSYLTEGGGKIINIASRAAHRGDAPDYLHYGASKGALTALTKGIARGFAKDNILAFTIAPGFTKTEMARGFVLAHGEEAATKDIPLGEMASPEEIGALVSFLAEKDIRHMTGATFDVNGASYVR
ncbi:MAG: SDR family oxidoreductase [Sphingomonadales bacterium]|jgi:NAD(P)-dependent dehydrogenase (short-subunit alcohol dehydrogenase family)